MRNQELLNQKLNESLNYLYKQEETLKPFLDKLQSIMESKISESEISFTEAFDMYCRIQEQYTNSILLIAKIKEMIEFS